MEEQMAALSVIFQSFPFCIHINILIRLLGRGVFIHPHSTDWEQNPIFSFNFIMFNMNESQYSINYHKNNRFLLSHFIYRKSHNTKKKSDILDEIQGVKNAARLLAVTELDQ